MEAAVLGLSKRGLKGVVLLVAAASLAGCAAETGRVPVGFAGGGDCQSVRGELRKLDSMGVPGQIQARAAGQHMSADANSRIDRYNYLLEQYLGNDCQLPPK
jgi:outer membrane biogenesis lipoprotein LolB